MSEVFTRAREPLFGRQRELAGLDSLLTDAESGVGRLVLVEADGGAGKTVLAQECAVRAADRGVVVAWGRSWEEGGAPAFWPWVQALRALLERPGARDRLETCGAGGQQIRDLVGDPVLASPDVSSSTARFSLFDGTVRFMRELSRSQPLLVVLDDLHAADDSTLQLLRFVARELPGMAALVIGCYRGEELRGRGEVVEVVSDLLRDAHVMTLTGLDTSSMVQLIQHAHGAAPDLRMATELNRVTDGNPFFAREILRLLRSESAQFVDALPELRVPAHVGQAFVRRVARAPEEVRKLLDVAAVIGRDFDAALLSTLTGSSSDEVLRVLDVAVELEVVRLVGASATRFTFVHGLARRALYDALLPSRRATLHAAVANALERAGASLSEVAHHLRSSLPIGDPAKAFEATVAAARHSMRVLAYEDAIALLRAGNGLADRAAASGRQRTELLCLLGRAQIRAGDLAGGRDTLAQAVERALAEELVDLAADGVLSYAETPVEGGLVDDRLVGLLRRAYDAAPDSDTALRALLLARLSHVLMFSPDWAGRRRMAEQALALADEGEMAASTRCRVIEALLGAVIGAVSEPRWLQLADEGVQLAREIGDREMEAALLARRSCWLLGLDRMEDFAADAARVQGLADELEQPVVRWFALQLTVVRAFARGELDEVRTLASAGEALAEHVPNAIGATSLQRVTVALERDEGLADYLELSRFLAASRPGIAFEWRTASAVLEARLGVPVDLAPLVEEARRQQPHSRLPYCLSFLVDAAQTLADATSAAVLYELLLPYAAENTYVAMGPPVGYFGSVHYYLGVAAALCRHSETAERHLRTAIERAERGDAPGMRARARAELAHVLAEDRSEREAHQMAVEVLPALIRTGHVVRASRVRTLLDRLSGVSSGAAAAPVPTQEGTFRLDGEYWTVTFQGRTSRIRDGKGVRQLAELLRAPGKELAALELVRAVEGHGAGRRVSHDERLEPACGAVVDDRLDPVAKAQYRRRLEELADDLREAEELRDAGRADRARTEMEFLARELSDAFGLGGRRRRSGPAEQARVAVTKALRRAIDRLSDADPELGRHLRATVRTGTLCSYTGDPVPVATWQIMFRS
jgi:hypothetical protein